VLAGNRRKRSVASMKSHVCCQRKQFRMCKVVVEKVDAGGARSRFGSSCPMLCSRERVSGWWMGGVVRAQTGRLAFASITARTVPQLQSLSGNTLSPTLADCIVLKIPKASSSQLFRLGFLGFHEHQLILLTALSKMKSKTRPIQRFAQATAKCSAEVTVAIFHIHLQPRKAFILG
jgi:hypothetical protein